ncbi:MAG: hypothetical protein HY826_15515 [Actinobacteria bacterium]|nr:hypothetical protein [Actinomycetota bacterium]
MTKLRGIQWIEDQTGQVIDPPNSPQDDSRHLSLRLPIALHSRLEEVAADRNLTVSQLARQLLTDGVQRTRLPDREAIDVAIAALDEMRRRLPPSAA